MGGIWKEWGDVGEEVCWGEGDVRVGVGDVGKYEGGVEECMG